MKIAIATEGTQVSAHFGKCENFTIVDIENSTVVSQSVINTVGNQHDKLPIFILTHGAYTVLSGGMGDGARQNLKSNGIGAITGVTGSVDEAIKAYIAGTLVSDAGGCSEHGHEHSHEHHHGDGKEEGSGGCKCGH